MSIPHVLGTYIFYFINQLANEIFEILMVNDWSLSLFVTEDLNISDMTLWAEYSIAECTPFAQLLLVDTPS